MTREVDLKYTYYEKHGKDKAKTGNESRVKDKHFVCTICGKNFYRKSNLTAHMNSHKMTVKSATDEKNPDKDRQNSCNICHKKFTAKKNLLKHLREVHKNYKEAERMRVRKIKCPERDCDFLCRMMKELRDHIESNHKIKILKDTLQFSNEIVFQKWKKEEESNTVSWFVTGRKKTTLTDGTKKQTLCCHRTGHYNPKGFGKYRMRSMGSCKIGVTCPAAMEITEHPDGQLTVIYYKTHLGHMQDVVYLKLSREERAHLVEKIEQGFTFDAILEDVKESSESRNSKTKRIHLLSKKDLYSIMRTANNNNGKKLKIDKDKVKSQSVAAKETAETIQEEALALRDMNFEKVEDYMQQNYMLYPAQNVIFPQGGVDAYENSTLMQYNKHEREDDIPQNTGEGIASQIVILSPEIDYTSVAEIILLSADESGAPAGLPQNKIVKVDDTAMIKPEQGDEITRELTIGEKNRINRMNLRLKIEEKITRILEFLPKSEFLTPKQFDLVNAKLDAILNVFNLVSAKAKTRKQNSKKVMYRNTI